MTTNEIQLHKSEFTFEQLPTSVQQFLLANLDAIEALDAECESLSLEVEDLRAKEYYADAAGLSAKGIRGLITRRENKIEQLLAAKVAYQKGYMEIPNLDRHSVDIALGDASRWGVSIPNAAPVRVFKALASAVAEKTFTRLVLYDQVSEGDPIVAGIIGDRRFFVAAWR